MAAALTRAKLKPCNGAQESVYSVVWLTVLVRAGVFSCAGMGAINVWGKNDYV